jgi:hypothetical protein
MLKNLPKEAGQHISLSQFNNGIVKWLDIGYQSSLIKYKFLATVLTSYPWYIEAKNDLIGN